MKTNKKLSADSTKEQRRLRREFPDEVDIFRCKRGEKSCYIKHRLQPSRAFGDLTLKWPEFNNPNNLTHEKGYRKRLKIFTGPYIRAKPVIKVFKLDKSYMGYILATDGLWDELSKQRVLEIIEGNRQLPLRPLLLNTLRKAANESRISFEVMRKLKPGKRRRYHDDISMVYVRLD